MKGISQLGNPNDIIASFCAKILLEAQLIEKSGFPANYRDLFTEQGMYIVPCYILCFCDINSFGLS